MALNVHGKHFEQDVQPSTGQFNAQRQVPFSDQLVVNVHSLIAATLESWT